MADRFVRASSPRCRRTRVLISIAFASLAVATGMAGDVQAHEVRPGYLEINSLAKESWDLLFKVPLEGNRRQALNVDLPEGCETTDPIVRRVSGAYVERWRATCSDSLIGKSIVLEGLSRTRTDVLVRIKLADGTTQTARLTPAAPAFEVAKTPSQLEVAETYLILGVEHILGGVDHLLFVLGLLLLVDGVRNLITAITAFTVAHSMTLAAASLGLFHLSPAPVEAAIALSIVFVASEILRKTGTNTIRKPWRMAFAFGLLHGLGFAGALRDVGLPDHAIPLALAFFNIGVELGQLAFVAATLAGFELLSRLPRFRPADGVGGIWAVSRAVARPSSYAIGILGSFWLIDRTLSFWTPR